MSMNSSVTASSSAVRGITLELIAVLQRLLSRPHCLFFFREISKPAMQIVPLKKTKFLRISYASFFSVFFTFGSMKEKHPKKFRRFAAIFIPKNNLKIEISFYNTNQYFWLSPSQARKFRQFRVFIAD